MAYLIYLVFILLSFGQLQRISFFDQRLNIYLHEVVMGVVLIGGFGVVRGIREIREIGKYITIFLGILLLTLINNFWKFGALENSIGFLYLARLAIYFGFFFVLLGRGNKGDKGNMGDVKNAIGFFGWLTIFFSFLQYFLYPDLRNLYYLGWDPHHYRVFGLFFDTTVAGVIYSILFFWDLPAGRQGLGEMRPSLAKASAGKRIKIVSLVLLILLTYSRITYFVFIIGMIYFFKDIISYKKIAIILVSFLALLFVLPRPGGAGVQLERIFSIESRVKDQKEGLEIWSKNPLLGVGFNRIRSLKKAPVESHSGAGFSSSLVTLLAASGILGVLGVLGVVGGLWVKVDKLGKTLIIVVSMASFFDNIFLNNFVLLLFLSFMAMVIDPFQKKSSFPET